MPARDRSLRLSRRFRFGSTSTTPERWAINARARKLCLEHLVGDLAELHAHRLVIEQDDSLVRSDQEVLFHAVRSHGVESELVYEHMSPRMEPLLWIPDAIAWSWVKGGEWRDRIAPLIADVETL